MTLVRTIAHPGDQRDIDRLVDREWLVTNGLGGYASGSVAGVLTRRYHGLLVAAHPAPFGRVLLLSYLGELLVLPDGRRQSLTATEHAGGLTEFHAAAALEEFRLEDGLPVWRYRFGDVALEKRLLMLHRQNTTHVTYRLMGGSPGVRLELRPSVRFRPHDAPVDQGTSAPYTLTVVENRYEVSSGSLPALRLVTHGPATVFTIEPRTTTSVLYRMEANRGYPASADLWSPGVFSLTLEAGTAVTLIASSEPWETMLALTPAEGEDAERQRRRRLVRQASEPLRDRTAAELVLAADQFVIKPAGRAEESARAHAAGDTVATVIAGYHWFTDWGRDTMISLEGLTLVTGRESAAGNILRTFGRYMRDGLIPNLFPEGSREGLYHTADATLWFFHAVARYVEATGDRQTLCVLLPALRDSWGITCAAPGSASAWTRQTACSRRAADGYQLTWMDAKVDDWVVTPRRGKAVEINALWYNALRLLATGCARKAKRRRRTIWTAGRNSPAGRSMPASGTRKVATSTMSSTGRRATNAAAGRTSCSPCRSRTRCSTRPGGPRWSTSPQRRLLTPVGLRSLAPGEPDYKPQYYGDLRARDAAYHQGTVWAWLIGPFIDAWLRVHPGRDDGGAPVPGRVRRRAGRGVRRVDHGDLRCRGALRRRAGASRRPGASRRCCDAGPGPRASIGLRGACEPGNRGIRSLRPLPIGGGWTGDTDGLDPVHAEPPRPLDRQGLPVRVLLRPLREWLQVGVQGFRGRVRHQLPAGGRRRLRRRVRVRQRGGRTRYSAPSRGPLTTRPSAIAWKSPSRISASARSAPSGCALPAAGTRRAACATSARPTWRPRSRWRRPSPPRSRSTRRSRSRTSRGTWT